jgi:hypothetical protein
MPGVEPASRQGVLAVCAFVATLPVAFRRRAPIAAMAVTTAGVALPDLLGASQDALAPFAAMLLEAYALGAFAGLAPGLGTLAAAIVLLTAGDPSNAVFAALVLGAHTSPAGSCSASARRPIGSSGCRPSWRPNRSAARGSRSSSSASGWRASSTTSSATALA